MGLPLSAFTFALLLSFALAFFSWRRLSSRPFIDRLTVFLLFPMAVCLAAVFFLKIQDSLYSDYNWERLQNVFVIARGFPLYNGAANGPALITIYGPVSVFVYLPSALAASPANAMRIAEVILMGCFFLPPLWLHFGSRQNFLFRLLVLLIFCYFPLISKPLRDAAFNIHVDGPTLGLAAIACGLLYFRARKAGEAALFFSAVFAVLSVWSKQVAVPLLAALPLYLFLAEGRKTALRYTGYLLVSGILISALILFAFNPKDVIFNILVIPGRHSLRKGGLPGLIESAFVLLGEGAVIWILAAVSLVFLYLKIRPASFTDGVRAWPGSLFLITGITMIPTSILGNAKVGGSTNTLCYTCYFFLLAAALGFLQQASNRKVRFFLTGLSVLFLCIEIPWVYSHILSLPRGPNPAETAFVYIKKHPGEAYFPRLNMVHLMAENKVYHSSAALKDREWADLPISPEHFHAYLPERMKFMAFQKDTADDKAVLDRYLPEYGLKTEDPELPGFVVFKKSAFRNNG